MNQKTFELNGCIYIDTESGMLVQKDGELGQLNKRKKTREQCQFNKSSGYISNTKVSKSC